MSRESDAQEGLKVIEELAAAAKAGDPEAQAIVSTPALDYQHRMMSVREREDLREASKRMSEFDSEMWVEGLGSWEHLANVKPVPPPTQRLPVVFGVAGSLTVSRLREGACPCCRAEVQRVNLSGKQRELQPLGEAKDGWRELRAVDDSFVTIWQSLPCECLWSIVGAPTGVH